MYLEREESLLSKIYVSLDIIISCYYTELKQNNQVLEKMFLQQLNCWNKQFCKFK